MAIPIYDQLVYYGTPPNSYVGSFLFLTYIVLALYATISITLSLRKQYNTIYNTSHTLKTSNAQDADNLKAALEARNKHVRIYACVSVISFSALSLHMLNFLKNHYSGWTGTGDQIALSGGSLSGLKRWMLESTLFQDFAIDLVQNPANAALTQAAILGTWFWNIWMAGKAQQYRLPSSKTRNFILLSQILPISFTASLFIIQLHLSRAQAAIQTLDSKSPEIANSTSSEPPTSPIISQRRPIASLHLPNIMLNALLLAQPLFSRQDASASYTVPILLLERMILLLPHSGLLGLKDSAVVKAITISGAFVSTSWFTGRRELGVWSLLGVLTGVGEHAVKALGWDAVLGGLLCVVLEWGGAV